VRYEWITLRNEDFGTADPDRNGTNRRTFTSRLTALTPGLSADYALTDKWTALAGIHRGFAPPEPPTSTALAENAQEEKSTNIEAGVRYTGADTWGDLIGFVTHYENLLGRDSLSAGGSGDAEQFNGGEVNVHGLEAALHHDLSAWLHRDTAARLRPYRLPVSVGYTYTHSEFQNNFVSSFAEWGTVDKGDSLPYIPEHQFSVSAGIETPVWLLNLTARYTDRMRTVAGQGDFTDLESTDASIVLDANAEYEVTRGLRLFVNANNLLDEQYVAARRPSGVRPGAPQAVFAGIKVAF
jgi:Fe(3+) dicitrate transport protein